MSDTNSKSDTGRIVWYELMTTDPKAAIEFYGHVVGWKTEPFEGGAEPYTMWIASQGPLGGVAALPDKAKEMGAPPHWQANVLVPDVEMSAAKVKRLGGKVLHNEEVAKVGRFTVVQDPQGATVALFQPAREMKPHDVGKHGEFSWHELYTTDNEAALSFYKAIAGWERIEDFDMGAMGKYILWGREGKQMGGMMTKPAGMKAPDGSEVPTSWMYYITVEDFDAAFARALAKGATLLNGPMPVPGGQRIVQLKDPQGAVFALVTPPADAAPPAAAT